MDAEVDPLVIDKDRMDLITKDNNETDFSQISEENGLVTRYPSSSPDDGPTIINTVADVHSEECDKVVPQMDEVMEADTGLEQDNDQKMNDQRFIDEVDDNIKATKRGSKRIKETLVTDIENQSTEDEDLVFSMTEDKWKATISDHSSICMKFKKDDTSCKTDNDHNGDDNVKNRFIKRHKKDQ